MGRTIGEAPRSSMDMIRTSFRGEERIVGAYL